MEESVEKQRKRRTTAGENGEKIRRAERERGEIWYELSGARWLEENSTESYERGWWERKKRTEGAPSSGRGHSIAKNKENTNNTKSDESDDDTAYNARDGSKRSQVDRKRAKEEWAIGKSI